MHARFLFSIFVLLGYWCDASEFGFESTSDGALYSHPPWDEEDFSEGAAALELGTQGTLGAEIVSSCTAFVNYFGDLAANFSRCAMRNARPFKFCEQCIVDFAEAMQTYHLIMEGKIENGSLVPKSCKKILLESDRVQLVVKMQQNMRDMWDDSDCMNCFEFDYEQMINGTVVYEPSDETLLFTELNQVVNSCFRNNTQAPLSNSTVCDSCHPAYHNLSVFYDVLEDKHNRKVCMDVVDAMNVTRMLWSQHYKCREFHDDRLVVIVMAAAFCVLPVIFYSANRAYGARLNRRLAQQKRLRDVKPDGPSPSMSNMSS